MLRHSLAYAIGVALAASAVTLPACAPDPIIPLVPTDTADAAPDVVARPDAATPSDDGGLPDGEPPFVPTSKLDLLLVVDNSASMSEKQEYLRAAVPELIAELRDPPCVDASNGDRVVGRSQDGQCATGVPAWKPVRDLHVGVVTTSLGGAGSDACAEGAKNPVNPALLAHTNDRGHLITRGGAAETPVALAEPAGFLAWTPGDSAAASAERVRAFQDILAGVHEYGCGYEAQLESWYRFLVQPDPYESVGRSGARAELRGVDATILKQRSDFLRPDSAVAVVLVTDENDSHVDPMALRGQAFAVMNTAFPGSPNGSAPRGTSACASAPATDACTSCAYGNVDPNGPIARDPSCQTNGGYLEPASDNLNVRFFEPKRRFGLEPRFPLARYVRGLRDAKIPDRAGEHPTLEDDYKGEARCTNPLFAARLPTRPDEELCDLPRGPRVASQVFFGVIGGVPHRLLAEGGAAEGPLKASLTAADWEKIVGRDPARYDATGADPHMVESLTPRAGLPPPTAANDADPIHGRERETNGADLQYACTFPLAAPKDCERPENKPACDCASGTSASPLCVANPNSQNLPAARNTLQVRGKAYPSVRELAVAKELGAQAVVASACPVHGVDNATKDDPLYGYRPAMRALLGKLRSALAR